MDSIIAIICVFLGVFLSEFFRRHNRVETFNNQIFNRRLEDYMKLNDLINYSYVNATDLLKCHDNYTEEELLDKASAIIYPIITFSDQNSFFISDELLVQCCTLFMGIEDVDSENFSNKEASLTKEYKLTIKMIKDEAGVNKMNKSIKKILKYNHNSDIISYYNNLKINKQNTD